MRPLREIAIEIEADWKVISNNAAREALSAMKLMGNINAPYLLDSTGHSVVAVFLTNAVGWKGPIARKIKKELRQKNSA